MDGSGRSKPTALPFAAGGITESLILAKNAAEGINYSARLDSRTRTIKVFIDIFVGVWAFILATSGPTNQCHADQEKGKPWEIWQTILNSSSFFW